MPRIEALDGAVVIISMSGEARPMTRPAAFVFETAGGIAWIEPSYADPAGAASPALHVRTGRREGDALIGSGWRIDVLPYEAGDQDLVGDALDWFADWLRAEGRTWQQERDRVRAMIADILP